MNPEVKIVHLKSSDVSLFTDLVKLFSRVFEEKVKKYPSKEYLKKLLARKDFHVFVALSGTKVIGGITAYELQMYDSESSELFIYDVAVDNEFQYKGVGKKLIAEVRRFCKRSKIKGLFVAANEEDKHALRFYKATGARDERVIHFNY